MLESLADRAAVAINVARAAEQGLPVSRLSELRLARALNLDPAAI